MNKQEPFEREEFPTAQDSPVPVDPSLHDHSMHHHDGLVEPKIKEYVPLEVGIVIFSIIVLVVAFAGMFSNMWGLID